MAEATYTVEGMTCGHCATSVREEVSELDAGAHFGGAHATRR